MSTSSMATSSFDLSLLRCAAGTDVGMRREENQDSFGIIKQESFQGYFVADGMGGARGGATASRMAIAILQETLNVSGTRMSSELLTASVEKINQRIFAKGSTEPSYAGMGTTLVGLVFTLDGLLAVNVGDSRAYRIRGSTITQISEDHTLVRELVESGALAADEAEQHPISHMLTRSLGPVGDVDVECKMLPEIPEAGDIYVVCSDGLYNFVPPEDILEVVRQNPIDDANQILINLANQRGGADNITALVITVGEKPVRGRKNSMPPTALESDSDPEPQYEQIISLSTALNEPPVIPPSVQEPKDPKAKRKAAKEKARSVAANAKTLPTMLALGATLVVGLILGNFARRATNLGADAWDFVRGLVVQPESAQRVDDEDGSTDSNPLATLARQIRSERDDSSNAPSDTSSSTRRQPQQIEQSIERLRAQIKELDQPIPSTTESDTRMARQRLTQLEKEYTALESSLDVASRAVTLWLGRRVAFEGSDVALDGVSGAEQFGAYSVLIKEKLSLITDLAYQYREKADDAELHPEDPRIKTELEAIQRRREQAKRELAQEIRKVIDTTLSKSYKDYESLKIQRDLLWLDLQAAKQELEVQAGLADRDPQKRQQLRVALVEKLEFEQLALETARQNARGGLASR